MCGIGGVWGGVGVREPRRTAAMFSRELAHRGPDGEGVLTIGLGEGTPRLYRRAEDVEEDRAVRAMLVHRRLSIIDLSTGDQPMAIAGGRLWIVFNGEIYNYRELRDEIQRHDPAQFETHSDTEVILRAYRCWGLPGLSRLNGIFAFALYDGNTDSLVLARDPIGVKPLYWSGGSTTGIAFASEIRPLLRGGYARAIPSAEGLAQFLFYRFVPAPGTVLQDVNKVAPGFALRFGRSGALVEKVDFSRPAPVPGRAVGTPILAEALRVAVGRQMLADVPVGAFLSGGLDSSLVVAALGPSARGLPTFAIGFPSSPDQESELVAADRAAIALETDHAGITVDRDEYFRRLPWAIAQVEEPVAHPGMLLQADLARLSRTRVKVVLTGQGADEPLGGYPRHHAARLLQLLAPVIRQTPALVSTLFPGEVSQRIHRAASSPSGVDRAVALFSPLSPIEALALVRGGREHDAIQTIRGPLEPWWARADGMDEIGRILYVDVRTSLAEDLLLVGDKMSMAHSLEARVPYVDLDYLAMVEGMPGGQRVRWIGRRKAIQHEVAGLVLPASLATSLKRSSSPFRRKRGFDVPVAEWLRRKGGSAIEGYLAGQESLTPAYVDREAVVRMTREFSAGRGSAYRQVLAFYVLETWLRAFVGGQQFPN